MTENMKPDCSSTPINHPRGRKSYRKDDIDQLSPIANSSYSPKSKKKYKKIDSDLDDNIYSTTEDELDEDQTDPINYESALSSSNTSKTNNFKSYGPIFFILFTLASAVLYNIPNSEENIICELIHIKTKFPLENTNTWFAIESGIEDVILQNKPSVFIFLYNENMKHKLNLFLKDLSLYSNCVLNTNGAIVVEAEELNTKENFMSYGNVIDKYKSELEEKAVMIVKDIDVIEGQIAQAFHSFCDEYTPLVKKSVVFFTIKTNDFKGKNIEIAESILRNKWRTLKGDILEPLLTRVTGMVLKFQPQ